MADRDLDNDNAVVLPPDEAQGVAVRLLEEWGPSFGLRVETGSNGALVFRGSAAALARAGLDPVVAVADDMDVVLRALDADRDLVPEDRAALRQALLREHQQKRAAATAAAAAREPDLLPAVKYDAKTLVGQATGGTWTDRDLLRALAGAAGLSLRLAADGRIAGVSGPLRTLTPTMENWLTLVRRTGGKLVRAEPEVRRMQAVRSSRVIERGSQGEVVAIHELA